MVVEYFTLEGPKAFPGYRWITCENTVRSTKAARGRERSFWPKALGQWVSSCKSFSSLHRASQNFRVEVRHKWASKMSQGWHRMNPSCDPALFFHQIPEPGPREASCPAGYQLLCGAVPPALVGEAWPPTASKHTRTVSYKVEVSDQWLSAGSVLMMTATSIVTDLTRSNICGSGHQR